MIWWGFQSSFLKFWWKRSTVYYTPQLTDICPNLTAKLRIFQAVFEIWKSFSQTNSACFPRPLNPMGFLDEQNCLHTRLMHCCTSRLVQLLAPNLTRRRCGRLRDTHLVVSCLCEAHDVRDHLDWPTRPLDSDPEKVRWMTWEFSPLGSPNGTWRRPCEWLWWVAWGEKKTSEVPTNRTWYDMWVSLASYLLTSFHLEFLCCITWPKTFTLRLKPETRGCACAWCVPGGCAWHLNIFWVYMPPGEA